MMMVMENDEFVIPEQYRKMSVAELEEEAKRVLDQINTRPRNIQHKKKAAPGQKEITFYL